MKLGDRVKDSISGLTGIAVARTEWLHGCVRWLVEPEETKDGKLIDGSWFDEPRLSVVEKTVPAAEPVPTGGPQNDPGPRNDPSRM